MEIKLFHGALILGVIASGITTAPAPDLASAYCPAHALTFTPAPAVVHPDTVLRPLLVRPLWLESPPNNIQCLALHHPRA